ncbi:hypothetical protein RIF29_17521 [Crotalaria pallida]|uniref:Uncharacterized protein n=1 Tax=Crotalaria pallida TaxID=3830 RepID=A0AAN9IEM0_CROPI
MGLEMMAAQWCIGEEVEGKRVERMLCEKYMANLAEAHWEFGSKGLKTQKPIGYPQNPNFWPLYKPLIPLPASPLAAVVHFLSLSLSQTLTL